MIMTASKPTPPIVIKKYANRRLYNTATSSYVTLDSLAEMVREDQEFTVQDARTGEDLTRAVLAQIMYEREATGTHLLPLNVMRQMIALYGDSLQTMVPKYIEASMKAFGANQERMRQMMKGAMGPFYPENLESAARQNLAMWEQGMKMFNPFAQATGTEPGDLQAIRQELADMHAEIDRLKGNKS